MGLPPIPPWALISSIARAAPLRMNSPYPPSGPERIDWQPILIGFLSFRSRAAAATARGNPRPATARALVWRKRRRVVPRRGAMGRPPTASGTGMIGSAKAESQSGCAALGGGPSWLLSGTAPILLKGPLLLIMLRWHREGFRLLWQWRSRPRGRRPTRYATLIRE